MSGSLVPPVESLHVSVPRRRLLPGWFARLRSETLTIKISRSSPSTARTWDVRFAGSPSRISSCVRATEALTTRMVRAPQIGNVDDQDFQIFAINCAHLGCPVRWFPQSNLFMCPCHGGAYYQDGSRASGPPERGLFQYPYKIEQGTLLIKAGGMPTPGRAATTTRGGTTCA